MKAIVVCRSAADYLKPGAEKGYFCSACYKELQVGPVGRERIAAGGTPFCNECGFALAAKLEVSVVILSPQAQEQIVEKFIKARQARNN